MYSKVKKCKSKISQQLLISSGLFYKIMVCIGVFINMYIYALNKAMGKPWAFCTFQVCVRMSITQN